MGGSLTAGTPVELIELLALDARARSIWDSLAPSHQREHSAYVAEAKKPETRQRRAKRTIERLLER